MFKKAHLIVPVLAGLFLMQSCQDKNKKGEFSKTATGLEYQLYAKGKDGKYESKEAPKDTLNTAKIGQVITMQQVVKMTKDGKDTVLYSSYDAKMPAMTPVSPSRYKGSLEEAFRMLTVGDSAVFRISADTMFAKGLQRPLPPYIKPGSKINFFIKVEKIQSQEQAMADYQKEMMAQSQKQVSVDDAIIQKYMKENNLAAAQKTPSGVYYLVTQPGNGPMPKAGQKVSVQYRGTTLNGKEFDSSAKHGGTPFEFVLGQGQVIRGWDEGIAMLNKGSKATLLIPSTLGYGQQGAGADIPANAVLRFDVELVDFK